MLSFSRSSHLSFQLELRVRLQNIEFYDRVEEVEATINKELGRQGEMAAD